MFASDFCDNSFEYVRLNYFLDAESESFRDDLELTRCMCPDEPL